MFNGKLSSSQVNGLDNILLACAKKHWTVAHTAYALATALHETAKTMQPIKEYGGPKYYTKLYDVRGDKPARAIQHGNTSPGDGPKYCGRGFVQLTWKDNYARAERETRSPLVSNPDLAMDTAIASAIMVSGMSQGWFTGVSLTKTLPNPQGTFAQFKASRKIINGTDKDDEIATYAIAFQNALNAGEWK
jgi:hypothetical protein